MNVAQSFVREILGLPPRALESLARGRVERDGQVLDPGLALMLAAMKRLGMHAPADVAAARAKMDEEVKLVAPDSRAMRSTIDLTIGLDERSLAARFYEPRGWSAHRPMLVFLHGGGFVLGGLASHDAAVRELADLSKVAVLAVDYRLAPEHRAPALGDDAFDAFCWARAHAARFGANPAKVALGGDSAGGNLTAIATHACRRAGIAQPALQVLIYPATDLTRSSPSHTLFGEGFVLDKTRMDWFMDHYLNDASEKRSPRLSPLFEDRFDGLAPALVVTAGFDPLRDEGVFYADKLRAAGVSVDAWNEASLIHGFFNMTGALDAASAAMLRLADKLEQALAR